MFVAFGDQQVCQDYCNFIFHKFNWQFLVQLQKFRYHYAIIPRKYTKNNIFVQNVLFMFDGMGELLKGLDRVPLECYLDFFPLNGLRTL